MYRMLFIFCDLIARFTELSLAAECEDVSYTKESQIALSLTLTFSAWNDKILSQMI